MQFLTIALLALSATFAHATCNKGGQAAVSTDINPFIPSLCTGLSGFYLKNEQRHQCVTDKNQIQWDFTLKVHNCTCPSPES